MNKILVAVRKAKGATEGEIAALLDLSILEYNGLESYRHPVTPDAARKLSAYFSVPAWYFLDASKPLDNEARIALLRKQINIINKPEYRTVPASATVALATTTIELMIAKEELGRSLARELELAEDLAVMTRMYEYLSAIQDRFAFDK